MTKNEFLSILKKRLSYLPYEDVEKSLEYYEEIIEDRIEDGVSEEEAVKDLGSIEEIENEIISNMPLSKIVVQKIKPKRKMSVLEIVLLVLGSPIWLALLISLFAVFISAYAVLFSVVVVIYALTISLIVIAGGGVLALITFIIKANYILAGASISLILISAGLFIFLFYGCKLATNGTLILTKKIILWIKNCFIKKEVA